MHTRTGYRYTVWRRLWARLAGGPRLWGMRASVVAMLTAIMLGTWVGVDFKTVGTGVGTGVGGGKPVASTYRRAQTVTSLSVRQVPTGGERGAGVVGGSGSSLTTMMPSTSLRGRPSTTLALTTTTVGVTSGTVTSTSEEVTTTTDGSTTSVTSSSTTASSVG